MTQRERILSMLRERGPRGVHSFEFYEQRMPRAAAAICDLRRAGYDIASRPETFRGETRGVRYVLRSASPDRPKPSAEQTGGSLFGVTPAPSRNPYDYDAEAA